MDILQTILGGGQQQQQFQDFSKRYEKGSPWDNVTDDEALQNYRQVSPHLSQQEFEEVAEQSYSRLSPQQRTELGRYLLQGSQKQGVNFPDANRDGVDDRMQDPRYLAQMSGQIRQQQPGLFSQLLGSTLGGATGMTGSNNMMGAIGNALGGATGMPNMGGNNMRGATGAGAGGMEQMLNSPIARAALAGIAATAVQRMMSGRR